MHLKISSLLLLLSVTLPSVYTFTFSQQSVQSHIFEPLRPKQSPKYIAAECGSVITEVYGQLEKSYNRGEVEDGSSCTWLLRAPTDHIVHVILVGFNLLNQTTQERDLNDFSSSRILLHDQTPLGRNTLSEFIVTERQHVSAAFIASKSSGEELTIEIIYHDNKVYSTQQISIRYQFLHVHEMNRLLRAFN